MLPRYFRAGVKYTNANAAASAASMISGFHAKSAIRDFRVSVWAAVIQPNRLRKNLVEYTI
jgi:hypothetical protein